MKVKLEKFDGSKTYMFPNGDIATPDVIRAKFPAVDRFPHVIEVNGNVAGGVYELQAMLNLNDIDGSGMAESEQIAALQNAMDAKRNFVPVREVTAEERIAAALEYRNASELKAKIPDDLIQKNVDRGLWSKEQIDALGLV